MYNKTVDVIALQLPSHKKMFRFLSRQVGDSHFRNLEEEKASSDWK